MNKFISRVSSLLLAFTLTLLVAPGPAVSQVKFPVDAELQGRVEFWKLIFSKYGKEDIVFHHRQYPEIIYSVLDFREFAAKYSGARYEKEKRGVLKQEEKNIKTALVNLAKGRKPSNSFEQRIQSLFVKYSLDSSRHYEEASSDRNIRSQTGIKERFASGLVRAGRYLDAIETVFVEAGLPDELGRLPLVESSFDYKAYSSVGAAGIWQFMRSTGRQYMTISAAIDDRRDPIAATRAAARYLGNAYEKLGSWPLAITSYNHGLSGIMRAVKQVGSRRLGKIVRRYESKTFGFASSNFYPEFVAALHIEQNTPAYFPQLVREAPLSFDEVELGRSLSFRDAVRMSSLPSEDFQNLNRGLRSPITKGKVKIPKGYIIKVPKGLGNKVAANVSKSRVLTLSSGTKEYLANKPKRLRFEYSGSTYRVRSGDNLGAIARRFRVPRRDLMEANNIRNANRIVVGQRLVIPGRGAAKSSRRNRKKAEKSVVVANTVSETYVVRAGDTIEEIAKRHSVSQRALMSANNISDPKRLFVGKKLKLPGSSSSNAKSEVKETATTKSYQVRSGDNLSLIAKKHGMSLRALRAANPGLGNVIRPGQSINVQ